jgi:hypothetical protein
MSQAWTASNCANQAVGNIQPALAPINTSCWRGMVCAISQSAICEEAGAQRS